MPPAPPIPHLAARAVSGRLPGLDALRGIAALCVLYFHLVYHFTPFPELKGKGYLAVDFFFMLSGYVMARTYEYRFAEGYGVMRFMRTRYWRLWPVMAIGAVIGTPMVLNDMGYTAQAYATAGANILLLPAIGIPILYPANFAAWSIFGELVANFVHGAVAWRWRSRTLIACVVLLFPAMLWYTMKYGSLDFGIAADSALGGVVRALFAYSIGIVLFRRWRDAPPLHIPPVLAFVTMPALLVLSVTSVAPPQIFDLAFIVLVCPLLIAGGLALRHEHWIATWLGLLSFPLYAVHGPVLQWSKGLGWSAAVSASMAISLAILLALLTDPMAGRKLRKALASKGRQEVE